MNSVQDIWAAILEELSKHLTPTSINTWFSDCEPIDISDGKLVLKTTGEFKRKIILERFSDSIKEALKEIFSCDFDLEVLFGVDVDVYKKSIENSSNLPEMDGYTFENFIVGNSNKFAHAASLGVVKNPGSKQYNPLFIYGNSGLGKTHLLLAIGSAIHEKDAAARVVFIKGDDFTNELVNSIKNGTNEEFRQKYRNADLLLVDDIQFIAGKERTQEEFFHTFNNIYEAGHQIVLTSDRPPMEMAQLDDRLRTRFEGGLMADVQPPDLETRMAIIRDKAGHLGMALSDNAVNYIAEKITTNIRQIEGVVKRLTAYWEVTGDSITKEVVDKVIEDVTRTGNFIPKPDDIIEETARYFQISVEDIKGQSHRKTIAMPRHISIYLIRTLTNLSLNDIGEYYGGKNHATVLASIQKIEKLIPTDSELSGTIRDITSNINSRNR